MKQYKCYLPLLLLLIATITSCSPDEAYIDAYTTKPTEANALRITINRTGFLSDSKDAETRVEHDGNYNVTKFKSGDRIGIIGIKGSEIIYNNYEYKYNGSNWEATGNICYADPNITYIAYYPYSADMNGKKSETEIRNAFQLTTEQQTLKDENDLMAATATFAANVKEATFTMKHLLCLLELTPTYKYIWDGTTLNVTIQVDSRKVIHNGVTYNIAKDTKYLLVKPGTCTLEVTSNVSGVGSSTCQKDGVPLAEGKWYRINYSITYKRTDFDVGDPFYKTANNFGFPYPQSWTDTTPTGCTQVGVVAKKGTDFKGIVFNEPNYAEYSYNTKDTQTYKKADGTNLGTVRGYVFYNPGQRSYFHNDPPYNIPKTYAQTVHGFTQTYEKCVGYRVYNDCCDQTNLSNTSKWFIPGASEAFFLKDVLKDNHNFFWTCDRGYVSNIEMFYFCNTGGVNMTISTISCYDTGVNQAFMLAF